ncbi:DnaD domain protein [Oscillospiraceae bacterium OttesenSCG-928-G22]|nr:DnaD domain protein [Oscillospiraceae bacterium OttesenSCG-928-G22]
MAAIKLRDEPASLVLGREDLDRLLGLRDGDAALLYLYIVRNGGRFSKTEATKETGLSEDAVSAALLKLVSAALVAESGEESVASPEPAPADVLPHYPPAEIRHTVETDAGFSLILSFAETKLNKVLSPKDEEILLGIYDSLAFSPGLIMLLLAYCVERAGKEGRRGARVSLRAVEREAFYWKRIGIESEQDAEAYIRRKTEEADRLSGLMQLFGLPKRKPTDSEREYLEQFLAFGMEDAVLYEAYDRTVLRTGGLKWDYLLSILLSWSEKDIKTKADVDEKDPPGGRRKSSEKKAAASPAKKPRVSTGAVSAANRLKNRVKKEADTQNGEEDA